MKLARQTVIGSAALAEKTADTPAAKLRENVTSPGGTTAAALDVLIKNGKMQSLFDEAIAAAAKRGKELAK
jgi:pyrroline-5-carboxylate reductase